MFIEEDQFLNASVVAMGTMRDPVLGKVLQFTQQGWPNNLEPVFQLYVKDLLQVPKRCRALGYVDDTKVFMALPSSQLPESVTAVNQDLRDISSWCCAHSLLINPDKTKSLRLKFVTFSF